MNAPLLCITPPQQATIEGMKKNVTIDPVLFGAFVSDRRTAANMKQSDLGRAVFPSGDKLSESAAQSRVSRLECGKIRIDDHLINRVAAVLKVPISTVQKQCAHGQGAMVASHCSSISFATSFVELFPALDSYVKIINEAMAAHDKGAAIIAFDQMCKAAHRRFSIIVESESSPLPAKGDRRG